MPALSCPETRRLLSTLALLLGAALAAWALRTAWVEPPAVAEACAAGEASLRCALRAAAVQAFLGQRLAWAGLAAAGLAWAWPRAGLRAGAALACGLALGLYQPGPAALGAWLLLLAAGQPGRPQAQARASRAAP